MNATEDQSEIRPYHRSQKISNLDALAKGLNCRYLECIYDSYDSTNLIAKQWRRKAPKTYEVLIDFTLKV